MDYLHKELDWISDRLRPESQLTAAAIHRDEASPHLHVLAFLGITVSRTQSRKELPQFGAKFEIPEDINASPG